MRFFALVRAWESAPDDDCDAREGAHPTRSVTRASAMTPIRLDADIVMYLSSAKRSRVAVTPGPD